jgi:condensin complex subunit 1
MAEQAINTIYLLGEQPDAMCSEMLKHLTANVFATPPSSSLDQPTADAVMDQDEDSSSTLPSTPLKSKSLIPDTPFTGGAFEPEPTPMPQRKHSDSLVPGESMMGTQMSLGSQEMRDDSATPVPTTPAEGVANGLGERDNGKSKEDSAPAFKLAQLVFAVGHVAVKHIVYLELVEREFKRRKDANAKGQSRSLWPLLSSEVLRCEI